MMRLSRKKLSQALAVLLQQHPHARKQILTWAARTVATHGWEHDIDSIVEETLRASYRLTGRLEATVTTATALSPSLHKKIQHFIQKKTGASHVSLSQNHDPHIIGGFTIISPLGEIDCSVTTALNTLKHA